MNAGDFLEIAGPTLLLGLVLGGLIGWFLAKAEAPAEITSRLVSLKLSGRGTDPAAGQLPAAFERLQDVAQAVVSIVEAPPEHVHDAAGQWFSLAATSLGESLRVRSDEMYRVAIWEDQGDPDYFQGIGWAGFDPNDPAVERLAKNSSLAGLAFGARSREYYSPDVDQDANFVRHSDRPKRYRSIFAVALGRPAPWGVLTIDARAVDGLNGRDKVVARGFATILSLGYAVEMAIGGPLAEVAEGGPMIETASDSQAAITEGGPDVGSAGEQA